MKDTWWERLAAALLLAMFLVILAISALVICHAFARVERATDEVSGRTQEAARILSQAGTTQSPSIVADAKATIRELEATATNAIGEHAISFLFEVFSIALVSAGVFLLTRAQKEARTVKLHAVAAIARARAAGASALKATQAMAEQKSRLDARLIAAELQLNAIPALQYSHFLSLTGDHRAQEGSLIALRDELTSLSRSVLGVSSGAQHVETQDLVHLLDVLDSVEKNLGVARSRGVEQTHLAKIDELLSTCQLEIRALLRPTGGVENH